jgi:hypothetical protein
MPSRAVQTPARLGQQAFAPARAGRPPASTPAPRPRAVRMVAERPAASARVWNSGCIEAAIGSPRATDSIAAAGRLWRARTDPARIAGRGAVDGARPRAIAGN